MGRMNVQRIQYIEHNPELDFVLRRNTQADAPDTARPRTRRKTGARKVHSRHRRRAGANKVFRRRRAAALIIVALIALMIITTPAARNFEGADQSPINPKTAAPDTVLASVGNINISTPIHPAKLSGLGYHSDGGDLLGMQPRGRNLSMNPVLGIIFGGSTKEGIQYYKMDSAGRSGPQTGALDVGAKAGTSVYSPVNGVISAIRPDPLIENADVVEIQPSKNPNVRVAVSLVGRINEGVGVDDPVMAGKTKLGKVADSAAILKTQLSSYIPGAGNHVTVSVYRIG